MTIGWHFNNTYSKLSDTFREEIKPVPVNNPELVIINENLASELNLDFSNIEELMKINEQRYLEEQRKFFEENPLKKEDLQMIEIDSSKIKN